MRTSMLIGAAALLAAASAAGAAPRTPPRPEAPKPAPSAERFGTPASYRGAPAGHGYTARDRHLADCLATYRGYDPATDRVVLRPGVTRRCEL